MERERQSQAEIPVQLLQQPRIGESVKALVMDARQLTSWLNASGKIRKQKDPSVTDFQVEQEADGVKLIIDRTEDQTHVYAGKGLVSTTLASTYDMQGFVQHTVVKRSTDSVVPSTEREFVYSSTSQDGTRKVIGINDYYVYASGKKDLVVRQTLQDDKPQVEYYPGQETALKLAGMVHDYPSANQVVDLSDSLAKARKLYEENPEGLLQVKEVNPTVCEVSSIQPLFTPLGEYMRVQRMHLQKDAHNRWHVTQYNFSFLDGGVEQATYFGSGEGKAKYNRQGYVTDTTSSVDGVRHVEEHYTYYGLPLYDESGSAIGQKIQVFDIDQKMYNPLSPKDKPVTSKKTFIDFVILRNANAGKGSNFGVSVVDKGVSTKEGEEGKVVDKVLNLEKDTTKPKHLIQNPDIEEGFIFRDITFPDQRTIRVRLRLDAQGGIIQDQPIHPMLLAEK